MGREAALVTVLFAPLGVAEFGQPGDIPDLRQ
jgi:hypothetical protein